LSHSIIESLSHWLIQSSTD